MITVNNNVKLNKSKQSEIQVNKFVGGSNTLFSENRLNKDEAVEALNLLLVEDGVWDKRWGTDTYPQFLSDFSNQPGGIREYRKSDGTRELIAIGDGVFNQIGEDGTKTVVSGATFTNGYTCDFLQINNYLYVANGQDDLARYDGTTLTNYTGISTPAWAGTPLARGAGLSTGNYNYYYRVSASNSIGETVPAATQTIDVDIDRDSWDEADEIITLDWDTSTNATGYVIYFGTAAGYEVKLAEVPASVTSYVDDGTAVPNPYIEPPTDNTSTAPKFSTLGLSGNRIWGTRDPDNPWRVYFSGTGVNLGNFAPDAGGGWIDLEKGGRATTTKVVDFQGKVHVVCETDDGRGAVWQVVFDNITIGSESIPVPVPTKIISSIGTSAAASIVHVENDVFFFNKRGAFVLGNEPGVLNVLRTNELSAKIRPYIQLLSGDSMEKVCAYYTDGKVLFSVPTTTGEPNRTLVFDRERSAWIKDWSIGASQFTEYTDSQGITRLLGIMGTKIVEFSRNHESDSGTAFSWRYRSPRFPVSDDWSVFSWIKEVVTNFRTVSGSIVLKIYGTNRYDKYELIDSLTIQGQNTEVSSGVGWDLVGDFQLGTTSGSYTPQVFANRVVKYKKINKLLREVQLSIEGSDVRDRAVILGFIIRGLQDKTSKPLGWQNSS